MTLDEAKQIEFCDFPLGYKPVRVRGDCTFDAQMALRACEMGPRYFRHSRGRLGGKPLQLEPWQKNIIGTLWGWRRPDGLRRYRNCYIEVGRGNGKSTMCAIIAGLLMYLDDEPGAEIIGAASARDQAREVFNVFKMSVASSPSLNRISKLYQNSVVRVDPRTGLDVAVYKVASAEAGTAHGGSAYGVIFDELHAQPNRELWDVLTSAFGATIEPLTIIITTAEKALAAHLDAGAERLAEWEKSLSGEAKKALAAPVKMALGVAVTNFVEELMARTPWLGLTALVLAVLAGVLKRRFAHEPEPVHESLDLFVRSPNARAHRW